MTINVGDKIPSVKLKTMTAEGPKDITSDEIFNGKKVVLFALPGAFTPTCSAKHLPGFVQKAGELKGKGVDTIACLSVNDAFVMNAWGKDQKVDDKVLMPGVICHATNVIEHPEYVAERIGRYASIVGRERVIAATDCGFRWRTHPQIAWAKLEALVEGARLASR